VVLGLPKLGAAGQGTAQPVHPACKGTLQLAAGERSNEDFREKLRVSKLRLADRSAATRKRPEVPKRSREALAHTRTALPRVPGSIKHGNIQHSKLQHIFTNLSSERLFERV
jgi:hypothetical protein